MPRRRPQNALGQQASRYNNAPQPWDALKNELEDLLGQVQDQITEFEGDSPYETTQNIDVARSMSGTEQMELRRQEALFNVQTAVNRLGGKQEKPKKKKKKKNQNAVRNSNSNKLDDAIAQIRASTQQIDASELADARHLRSTSQPFRREAARPDRPPQNQDRQTQNIAELTGQIEGLHRSVRDLAGQMPAGDSFSRIENQISQLSANIGEHQTPQADALSDQLDNLQYALERLAELQVRQIGHIEQLKTSDTNQDSQAGQERIEKSIRAIYEKFDTLEQSIDRPNSSIETIAKGIGSIARAVDGMQKHHDQDQSYAQNQAILAQIESVSQRLSAMDQGQNGSLTGDVKREMQGLRGQLVNALEPRFTALESRLDDFATQGGLPNIAPDHSDLSARLEEMEDRITQAISGIADIQSSNSGSDGSDKTVSALKAMEARLSETLSQIHRTGSQVSAGDDVTPVALQAMEQRISDAIERLHGQLPNDSADRFDGLRAIENKLTSSLKRLETLSTKSISAQPPALQNHIAPARVVAEPEIKTAPKPIPTPQKVTEPAVSDELVASAKPKFVPLSQAKDTPPLPRSSLATAQAETPAPMPVGRVEPEVRTAREEPTQDRSRESFIAAARRASLERSNEAEPKPNGGLLGRALERIKAVKTPKPDTDDAEALNETTSKHEPQIEQPPAIKEHSQSNEQVDERAKTLSVGPEPARPQSLAKAPKPRSTFESDDDDDQDTQELLDAQGQESFLTRNRQPILLAASVVVIIAMTANLVLDKGTTDSTQEIPTGLESADVSEAPRQISLTEVETALNGQQTMPNEMAALTDMASLSDQDIALTAPTPQIVDSSTITASIPKSPISVSMPNEEVGPVALREAAANGDPRAQYEVAMIYSEGKAVAKDSQAAFKWFERAAANGYAAAQYRLGTAYEHGMGVERNLEQAKLWYLRSAEAGNRMGMHNLAALNASAPDEERDFNAAARWFEEAAKRGVLDSQFNLGMLYARGLGVSQDFGLSYKWFSIAAQSGDKDAAKARDDVARSIDAAQMQSIKQELEKWQFTPINLIANYAPIGTWSKSFNPGEEIGAQKIVLNVQIALSKLGFDLGKPDGVIGPKTREAIRQFERTLGMGESGKINPRLLTVLSSQPV
ncbi:peptidoglycan-binding protein [Maritalea sp.]|uniref:peptidoglycan-binding protein n=1 Tax=Maritalea sp. TaxID=2003361 RepID=UPI003EF4D886